ncbi:GNAT family N-acetyltransferase [Legionella fallonii]|uniref:GNAT family N-acetyltransferase n=1 Tax=Legionella fallonii TaxID=96230 RepID=UPI0018D35319|nr:hypothetical protein [Legionella fallonii]
MFSKSDANNRGFKQVFLDVSPDNLRASRFYRKHGFVFIDEGLITNISDVLSELNLIDKSNDIDSLAKRISFMTKTSLVPRDDEHYEGMEMTTLTSNVSGYLM